MAIFGSRKFLSVRQILFYFVFRSWMLSMARLTHGINIVIHSPSCKVAIFSELYISQSVIFTLNVAQCTWGAANLHTAKNQCLVESKEAQEVFNTILLRFLCLIQ